MTQIDRFRQQLQSNIVLLDGAMGTYFQMLHPEAGEVEYANVSHPEWIQDIHNRYLEAGANVIRTNTFAVNHILFPGTDVDEVLVAATQNAMTAIDIFCAQHPEAGKDNLFIAGSIGPIRLGKDVDEEQVYREYCHICDVLLEQGIRIFVLETFADSDTVIKIAKYIKSQETNLGECTYVQSQFSMNRMGYTKYGYSMQRLVTEMEKAEDVDGFGFNCGIGVSHMRKLLEQVAFSKESIVSVLPNTGYEHISRERKLQVNHFGYYADHMKQMLALGVNIIGGCCGTTPEYIRELHKLIQIHPTPEAKQLRFVQGEVITPEKRNPFMEKLNHGKMVYVVEIDSPFNENADKFVEAAYRLKENEVDLVTISDSPMARPRAEAFEMGIYISNKTGIRVMPHVSCRDRNLIGLRSGILGGYINGIRDVLIITGDPVARDDRNIISSVFDVNSIRLMEYVKNMNQELFSKDPIYYGGALNYAGVNIDAIVTRMERKMEAGCSYFLTQPVYSDEDIERVRELKRRTGAKIIFGIMPLVSYKNATFMKNEMPGVNIPEEVLSLYKPEMSREAAENVAVDCCVSIGEKAKEFADGFYFMTPFNRVSLVNKIINRLREDK